jgi:hypothetical protein
MFKDVDFAKSTIDALWRTHCFSSGIYRTASLLSREITLSISDSSPTWMPKLEVGPIHDETMFWAVGWMFFHTTFDLSLMISLP